MALDNAMVGQFMLAQPLVVGGLFGFLLGDVQAGLLVGAMVQLLWIGILPVGAYVPSDHTVTGGITAALSIMLVADTGLPLTSTLALALAVAIPAGYLSGKLDILIRHLNSRIAGRGEWVAERYGPPGIDWLNLSGLVAAFLRNFIVYLIWLGPIALLVKFFFNQLPAAVVRGLDLVYWALPMLACAVVLEIIAKEKSLWLAAVIGIAALLLLMGTQHALAVFSGILALGALLACWRKT